MRIVFLGSGNVATQLSIALKEAGHEIVQVWSKTAENARKLAEILDSSWCNDLNALSPEGDLYLIAVSDDAISALADVFPFRNKLLVHTSGTTELSLISSASTNTGVFYPLQTFSKQRKSDFSIIPVAIEGSSEEVAAILFDLARTISTKVCYFDSNQRKALHIAAVFACNFSNHLYTLAAGILKENRLEFDLLRPLIAETASKVQQFPPAEVQTGPAVRDDQLVVQKHLDFLSGQEELQELYEKLSQSIINFHQRH